MKSLIWIVYVRLNDYYRVIRRKFKKLPTVTLMVDDMSQGNHL